MNKNNIDENFKKQDTLYRVYHIIIELFRFISIILGALFISSIEHVITGSDISFFATTYVILYSIIFFIHNHFEVEFYNRHYFFKSKKED